MKKLGFLLIFIGIAGGIIVFNLDYILYEMSPVSILLIFLCVTMGIIVFSMCYLYHKLTRKVNRSSLLVSTPFIIGCINTLLGTLLCAFFYLNEITVPLLNNLLEPVSGADPVLTIIFFPFIIIIIYYSLLAMPISLISILIAFIKRSDGRITGNRFRIVALINVINVALVPLFIYILFISL